MILGMYMCETDLSFFIFSCICMYLTFSHQCSCNVKHKPIFFFCFALLANKLLQTYISYLSLYVMQTDSESVEERATVGTSCFL